MNNEVKGGTLGNVPIFMEGDYKRLALSQRSFVAGGQLAFLYSLWCIGW